MAHLELRLTDSGVHRWERAEEVTPPPSEVKAHRAILARHAAEFDFLARRARTRGADIDEAALAHAKDAHLQLVHHALTHGDRATQTHLARLRIHPWEGKNDTGYHPGHHAVFIGTEALAGGYRRYGTSLAQMVAHETAHALDHRNGESRVGSDIQARLSRSKASLHQLPPRLRAAAADPREWAPRLLELYHEDRPAFHRAARRLRKLEVPVQDLLRRHLGLSLEPSPQEEREKDALA